MMVYTPALPSGASLGMLLGSNIGALIIILYTILGFLIIVIVYPKPYIRRAAFSGLAFCEGAPLGVWGLGLRV